MLKYSLQSQLKTILFSVQRALHYIKEQTNLQICSLKII